MSEFFDFKGPEKIDLKVVLILLVLGCVALVIFAGDQATFRRLPQNDFERIAAVLPTVGYMLTGNRASANIFAAVFLLATLLSVGLTLWFVFERRVLIPNHVKKMVNRAKAEEEAFNKFHQDS